MSAPGLDLATRGLEAVSSLLGVSTPREAIPALQNRYEFEEGDNVPDELQDSALEVALGHESVATPPPPPVTSTFASAVISSEPIRPHTVNPVSSLEHWAQSSTGPNILRPSSAAPSDVTRERSPAPGQGEVHIPFGAPIAPEDDTDPPDSGRFNGLISQLQELQREAEHAVAVPVTATVWDQEGPAYDVQISGMTSNRDNRRGGSRNVGRTINRRASFEGSPDPESRNAPRMTLPPPPAYEHSSTRVAPRPLALASRIANRARSPTRGLDELLSHIGQGSLEDRIEALEEALRGTNAVVAATESNLRSLTVTVNENRVTMQNHIDTTVRESEARILAAIHGRTGMHAPARRPQVPPAGPTRRPVAPRPGKATKAPPRRMD